MAMSARYWTLACERCRLGLHLGRLVEIDDEGLPVPAHFGGYRHPPRDEWIGGLRLARVVELFLIGHLGHPLSIVDTDAIGELTDASDEPTEVFAWITDPEALSGRYDAESATLGTEALVERWGSAD